MVLASQVMVWGVLMDKKRYSKEDWLIALVVTSGSDGLGFQGFQYIEMWSNMLKLYVLMLQAICVLFQTCTL